MHRFELREGELWCEEVRVSEVAKRYGTPLYLYSYGTLLDHFLKLKKAFSPLGPLICFSMKANDNLAICRALVREGAGLDVVSGGELKKALRVGANPNRIVYASVGKTEEEIEEALRRRILSFNVESEQELERIERICQRIKARQMVHLRLNPDVDPHTHTFISTGRQSDKFGMDAGKIQEIFRRRKRYRSLIFGGLHIHIGSQILYAEPFRKAIGKALRLVRGARRYGVTLRWLNIGGGLGIVYHRETPQTASEFAKAILPLLSKTGLRVILEPGRFIVGNSGILLTRVLYLKETPLRNFAIVDAGMNDLIRPSLYGAYHTIFPVVQNRSALKRTLRYDVVGPICESADFFARDRRFPPLRPGDLLAILGTGAYGFTMASNYNARPRAAEVMVRGKKSYLIRQRETFQELIRGEQIPSFLR